MVKIETNQLVFSPRIRKKNRRVDRLPSQNDRSHSGPAIRVIRFIHAANNFVEYNNEAKPSELLYEALRGEAECSLVLPAM